jgi:hypothetical protein
MLLQEDRPAPTDAVDVYLDSYHPKNYLCTQFEILFAHLDDHNGDAMWELLMMLPQNQSFMERILHNQLDWNSVFQQGVYRLLFYLKQVFDLSHTDIAWMQSFRDSGGLKALVDYLLTQAFDSLHHFHQVQVWVILLDIVHHYDARRTLAIDQPRLEAQCYNILR